MLPRSEPECQNKKKEQAGKPADRIHLKYLTKAKYLYADKRPLASLPHPMECDAAMPLVVGV